MTFPHRREPPSVEDLSKLSPEELDRLCALLDTSTRAINGSSVGMIVCITLYLIVWQNPFLIGGAILLALLGYGCVRYTERELGKVEEKVRRR